MHGVSAPTLLYNIDTFMLIVDQLAMNMLLAVAGLSGEKCSLVVSVQCPC